MHHATDQARNIASEQLQRASQYLSTNDGKGSELAKETREAAESITKNAQSHLGGKQV